MDKNTPNIFSESFGKALAEASKNWTEQLSSIAEQFSSIASTQVTIGKRLAESLQPVHDAIQRSLSSIDFSWVHEAWQQAMPPNWRELEPSDIDQVLAVMDETGWCLVWCPRTRIIRDLMDAENAKARAQVLLASKGAVLEDMDYCLAGMNHPESSEYRRAATLAIRAFDAGHVEAAQALAAADISAIINGGFGLTFKKAEPRFHGDPKKASIRAFREQAVFNTVSQSLQRFFADGGDPMPSSFSRHATIHAVSEVQYTEVNSLASLLLVVAFIKEADLLMEWADRAKPDVDSSTK